MKSYDKTLTRLILILTKLSNNELPTVKELAVEFAVGERTIQRDVYVRLAYFPIEKNSNHKLHFIEGFSLEHTSLEKTEMQLTYLALSMLKGNTSKIDSLTDNILSKLLLPSFSNPYFVEKELFEVFDPALEPAKSIIEAIDKKKVVNITTKYGTLKVEPYKIASFDKYWYLFGECVESQKIKTFPISYINSCEITQREYKQDRPIDDILNNVHSGWFEDGNSFEVKVKVDVKVAHFFSSKKHLSTQTIEETLSDGSLIITFEVSHEEDVDNLIKSWLPHITVIEPTRFKERIEKELRDYLSNTV